MHNLVWPKAWVQTGAQEQCQDEELVEDMVRDVVEQLLVDTSSRTYTTWTTSLARSRLYLFIHSQRLFFFLSHRDSSLNHRGAYLQPDATIVVCGRSCSETNLLITFIEDQSQQLPVLIGNRDHSHIS